MSVAEPRRSAPRAVVELKSTPKYYVGKTHQLEVRLPQHFQGRGTTWTIEYPPLRVHDVFKAHSPFDEDNVTKQFMEEKGIDNVRGGSYSQKILDPTVILMLDRELKSARGVCYLCNKHGHLASSCFQKDNIPATIPRGSRSLVHKPSLEKPSPESSQTYNGLKKWTTSEDQNLLELVSGKIITRKFLYDLAVALKDTDQERTYGSLAYRLWHLKVITEEDRIALTARRS